MRAHLFRETDAPLTRDHAERRLANGAEFSENLWLSGVPVGGGRVHQVSHALHRRPILFNTAGKKKLVKKLVKGSVRPV
jgi:hypothetical protein